MTRGAFGVLAGLIVWNFGFLMLCYLLASLWPEFAIHARLYQSAKIFSFTAPMACLLIFFWIVAEIGAGWVAMTIARQQKALWLLAGLGLTYAVAVHIVLFWARFPWWYNLAIITHPVPAVLLGGRLATAAQLTKSTRSSAP